MHCTLLYSGIRYMTVSLCALPNIEVTPTTMAIIISGKTSVCASLIVLAKALMIEISAIRNNNGRQDDQTQHHIVCRAIHIHVDFHAAHELRHRQQDGPPWKKGR